jgi:serine/threonine protein kinase
VGEQHGATYLIMEYVEGEALSTIHRDLKKKGISLPPGISLRIASDVCAGLHAAHELRDAQGELLGVVHRDVSPQNVLVTASGDAKLIDFGIAKARGRVASETNAGTLKGKVRYMAPEQAISSSVDRAADVWGVGAVLYDLLSGRPPYEGENDVQTLLALVGGKAPVALPRSVHPAIAAVVERALAPDPKRRFATAAEMQQAIEDSMIQASVATGTGLVARFLAEHLSERAQKRKESILLGLRAAADRERYAVALHSNVKVNGQSSDLDARPLEVKGLSPALRDAAPPARVVASTSWTGSSTALRAALRRSPPGRLAALGGIALVAVLCLAALTARCTSDAAARSASALVPPVNTPRPPASTEAPAPSTAVEAGAVGVGAVLDRTNAAAAVTSPPTTPARAPAVRNKSPHPIRTRVDDGF